MSRVRPKSVQSARRWWGGAAALLVFSATASAAPFADDREPRRDDVVARFSTGMVTMELGSERAMTHITGGRLSLSTNDARCTGALDAPCRYTINELVLESTEPFSIAGQTFETVSVRTVEPAFGQLQTLFGATEVRGLPFWVIGTANGGTPFAFFAEENPMSFLRVLDVRFGPTEQTALIDVRLVGTIDGNEASIRVQVAADTPFENAPPYLAPSAPDMTTSCVADVVIDAGLLDVDGDVEASWAELGGAGIGATAGPVRLPIGVHQLIIAADDGYGALAREPLEVRVSSDGTLPLDAGEELVTFTLPLGTSTDRVAVAASDALSLQPDAHVLTGTVEAPVASLGSLSLAPRATVGEAWATGTTTLGADAVVAGPLHAGGTLSAHARAVIEGGIVRDGPYTPGVVVRVIVPTVVPGPNLTVRPGGTATLPAGAHGAIVVGPRGRLTLGLGRHTMSSLRMQPGSILEVSGDASNPTLVRITGALDWNGSVVSAEPALLLVLDTTSAVQIHAPLEGWILAPRASVTLLPGASPYRGGVYARSVTLQPNVVLQAVGLAAAVRDDSLAACALTPVVTCVRSNPDGTFTAVFGYTSILPHVPLIVHRGPINRLYPEGLVSTRDFQFFAPRGEEAAFETTFTEEASWILGNRTATATGGSTPCP